MHNVTWENFYPTEMLRIKRRVRGRSHMAHLLEVISCQSWMVAPKVPDPNWWSYTLDEEKSGYWRILEGSDLSYIVL